MKKSFLFITLIFCFFIGTLPAQQVDLSEVEPGRFDFGRMWTFEDAPLDYFEETYGFRPDEAWLTTARKAALRFSSFCTASFVSPNGLIMTNHHCARGVVGAAQQEGENFEKNGFYATELKDERPIPGLFVDQLEQIADITKFVKSYAERAENDAHRGQLIQEGLEKAKEEYGQKADWAGLTIQSVTYYSGGKYSLYGFKRYSDIRVVLVPEADLGFYGGDPDNFTYPRYNLDCTFFRAYDQEGNPLNTSANYFKWNPDGIQEGNAVFVVGNPGSTERYRTKSQLEFDRDKRYPLQLEMIKAKYSLLDKQNQENPSDAVNNTLFSLSNSRKAFEGILGGLNNPHLFARKEVMENRTRASFTKMNPNAEDYWGSMGSNYKIFGNIITELIFLNPFTYGEATMAVAQQLDNYKSALEGGTSDDELTTMRQSIMETAGKMDNKNERDYLGNWLAIINKYSTQDYMKDFLKGRSPEVAANDIISNTIFVKDPKKADKMLKKGKKLDKSKDPMLQMATLFIPQYKNAIATYQKYNPSIKALEEKIANAFFQVHGNKTPPDATFTLRISDGVVKGYNYNGTTAPIKTTYFGLYDRFYSNDGKFPWSLPDRWKNPPMDLLKAPLNYVSTNDIIGGNSGSAMINKNLEAVGLIFDGNIESLPGNFIFDEEFNRTVSVHAGGITAAMRYIYKADRVLAEMLQSNK